MQPHQTKLGCSPPGYGQPSARNRVLKDPSIWAGAFNTNFRPKQVLSLRWSRPGCVNIHGRLWSQISAMSHPLLVHSRGLAAMSSGIFLTSSALGTANYSRTATGETEFFQPLLNHPCPSHCGLRGAQFVCSDSRAHIFPIDFDITSHSFSYTDTPRVRVALV